MKTFTEEEIAAMTKAQAESEISNLVYEAGRLYEQLERARKLYGNAHHTRQLVATFAKLEMGKRWVP